MSGVGCQEVDREIDLCKALSIFLYFNCFGHMGIPGIAAYQLRVSQFVEPILRFGRFTESDVQASQILPSAPVKSLGDVGPDRSFTPNDLVCQ